MEYTATSNGLTLRVYLGKPIPYVQIEGTDDACVIRIDADDSTTIKLLRSTLSHIVDTYKNREAQANG